MKIVMIDQDGVLLDKNYKTTADMQDFLRNLPEGFRIVPNSDTPVERILNNFKVVAGLQADITIGEKGAVVVCYGQTYFISNIQGIDDYLENLKHAFVDLDCDIAVGDSATWVREEKKFKPNRRMLIIDGLRKQTIGFYLRTTNDDGVACIDNQWFNIGITVVKTIPLPKGLEAKDFNIKYGIIIMNAINVSKTNGYLFLRQKYPGAVFYMIGDGDMDIIDDPNVIHCAVANASTNFKKIARFISDKEITAGLIDCLHWIAKQ